jgi:hypothetical protein
MPDTYDGKRSELLTFLSTAEIYMQFNRKGFAHEQERVLFIVSLLRGEAFRWIQPHLEDYLVTKTLDGRISKEAKDSTKEIMISMAKFGTAIRQMFGDIDAAHTADLKIRALKQVGSASDYAAKFTQYSTRLEDWSDGAKKSQFYQGLKDHVKDELVKDRPENLAQAMEKAIIIDNRAYERRLERKGNYSHLNHQKPRNKGHQRGDPMELDVVTKKNHKRFQKKGSGKELSKEERERRREKKLCFKCGLPGHMANSHKDKQLNAAEKRTVAATERANWTTDQLEEAQISTQEAERFVELADLDDETSSDESVGGVSINYHEPNEEFGFGVFRVETNANDSGAGAMLGTSHVQSNDWVSDTTLSEGNYSEEEDHSWSVAEPMRTHTRAALELYAPNQDIPGSDPDWPVNYPHVGQLWEVVQREELVFFELNGTRQWRHVSTGNLYQEPGRIPFGGPQYTERYRVKYRDHRRIGWVEDGGSNKEYMQQLPRPPVVPTNDDKPEIGEFWELIAESPTRRVWRDVNSETRFHHEKRIPTSKDLGPRSVHLVTSSRENHVRWRNVLSGESYVELCTIKKIERTFPLATTKTMFKEGQFLMNIVVNGHHTCAMLDTGAMGNFITPTMMLTWDIDTIVKNQDYVLVNINGEPIGNEEGRFDLETVPVQMRIGVHTEKIVFDVVPIGRHKVVLGLPWIQKHNPRIDWKKQVVTLDQCNCVNGIIDKMDIKDGFHNEHMDKQELRSLLFNSKDPLPKQTKEVCELAIHAAPEYVAFGYGGFRELFEGKPSEVLPKHQPWDHEIPLLPDAKLPFLPLRRMSEEQNQGLKEYVDKLLAKGFLRESSSSCRSIAFQVQKSDDPKGRTVIDYRRLNNATKKDSYPLPLAEDLRDRLRGVKWMTQLDLESAFHLIRMKEGEEWKTAFGTNFGFYEYLVMPMGLTNAPATCQRWVNNTLRPFLDHKCIAYLDDILIFGKGNLKQHQGDVREIMAAMQKAGMRLKESKCHFHVQEVKFLGFIVNTEGIAMDPAKIQEVLDWGTPTNVKEVQSFLGFTNYCRRFIRDYASITRPLTAITKKLVEFVWGPQCQEAMNKLKIMFTSRPVLMAFDPKKQIRVETDASDFALGAVLSQENKDGKHQPVAYHSRKFKPEELNYDIHDKELLAIVDSFKEWSIYLLGSKEEIEVLTDHKNLIYFTTTKELNRRQSRWSEEMAWYNYRIKYVKGSENARADALSRKPEYASNKTHESYAIFKKEGDSLVHNRTQLATTIRIKKTDVFKKLQDAPDKNPEMGKDDFLRNKWKCVSGVWIYNGKLYIPPSLRKEMVEEHHGLPAHGHQGIAKTLSRLSREYWFPGMREMVKKIVSECDTCIRNKASHHAPYGHMKSPDTPAQPWKSIAMDFVVKLPLSKDPWTKIEYDSILVIMCRLTKYAYLIPYLESSTAEDLAAVFTKYILANHGSPEEIISDRDKLFISKFWTTYTSRLGIKRKMSTAFHPQTDGQVERFNQTMESYLRCYVNYEQNNWVELLPLAQYAYNSSDIETFGVSPFYANYGYTPTAYGTALPDDARSDKAQITVDTLKEVHEMMAEEIKWLSERSAHYYNKKHSMEPTLEEGDRVYLLRRNIKTKRPSDKLDHKKLGPYKILEKKGPVNYLLQLPKGTRMNPVFHVALLEPAPPGAPRAPDLDIEPINLQKEWEVEAILKKEVRQGQIKYLIKWMKSPHSENSWEPRSNLRCPELLKEFENSLPKETARTGPVDRRPRARAAQTRGRGTRNGKRGRR